VEWIELLTACKQGVKPAAPACHLDNMQQSVTLNNTLEDRANGLLADYRVVAGEHCGVKAIVWLAGA